MGILKQISIFLLVRRGALVAIWLCISLIGILFITEGGPNSVWASIGTSLLAAAVVAFAMLWHDLINEPLEVARQKFEGARLMNVHTRRNLDRYNELVQSAKQIDVTGYSLRAFFESNREILFRKAREDPGFRARILLVNPDTEFSSIQEETEGTEKGTFRLAAQTIKNACTKRANIEVRLLNRALPTMIYRIDDVLFFGPYLSSHSSATHTFECGANGWMFERNMEEFESMWAAAIPA